MTSTDMTSTDGITPEEAPKAKRPRNLLAETKIYLTTPETLAAGLALVGGDWKLTEEPAGSEIGLYARVTGNEDVPALRSGAIYIGIATGMGGLKRRTDDEERWRGNDHAHGVALERPTSSVSTSITGRSSITAPAGDSTCSMYRSCHGVIFGA